MVVAVKAEFQYNHSLKNCACLSLLKVHPLVKKKHTMQIHRCRFVEYQPAAINALDFTPPTVKRSRLAVGRANGNIEIWDPLHNFRLEKTIPGGEGQSVESIAWAHQSVIVDQDEDDTPEEIEQQLKRQLSKPPRLFSSGLNPYIVEWDTTSMTVKVYKSDQTYKMETHVNLYSDQWIPMAVQYGV